MKYRVRAELHNNQPSIPIFQVSSCPLWINWLIIDNFLPQALNVGSLLYNSQFSHFGIHKYSEHFSWHFITLCDMLTCFLFPYYNFLNLLQFWLKEFYRIVWVNKIPTFRFYMSMFWLSNYYCYNWTLYLRIRLVHIVVKLLAQKKSCNNRNIMLILCMTSQIVRGCSFYLNLWFINSGGMQLLVVLDILFEDRFNFSMYNFE
jgi:hypothetical protein